MIQLLNLERVKFQEMLRKKLFANFLSDWFKFDPNKHSKNSCNVEYMNDMQVSEKICEHSDQVSEKTREQSENIPQDTFHRWQFYMDTNYEELRKVTNECYADQPDLDWTLLLHKHFVGTKKEINEQYEKYKNSVQDSISVPIYLVDYGKWIVFGNFKENRNKLDFFNRKTKVMQKIFEKHEEDQKLGMDLMKKNE